MKNLRNILKTLDTLLSKFEDDTSLSRLDKKQLGILSEFKKLQIEFSSQVREIEDKINSNLSIGRNFFSTHRPILWYENHLGPECKVNVYLKNIKYRLFWVLVRVREHLETLIK